MAAKNQLERLKKLQETVQKNTRSDINKEETEGFVDGREIAYTLVVAYKHYNPIKTSNRKTFRKAVNLLKEFGAKVQEDWKAEVKSNSSYELSQTPSKPGVLEFIIKASTPSGAENLFNDSNRKVTEKIMNSPKYRVIFSIEDQEEITAKGKVASAKKPYENPITKTGKPRAPKTSSLRDLQIAHGPNFSVFEAEQETRYTELMDVLNIENLPNEAAALTKAAAETVKTDMDMFGDRKFVYNPRTGVVSSKENVKITLSVQSARQNIKDASLSMSKGKSQKKLISKLISDLEAQITNAPADWGPDAKGSPSVKDGIGHAIVNTAAMKKRYATKKAINLTKYSGGIKGGVSPQQKVTSTIDTKKRRLKGGGPNSTMKAIGPVSRTHKVEKGQNINPESQANLMASALKVKNAINKALPSELLKNMGRPALEDKTGRFRQSARIEQITPAARTLLVKYTYRLNPYETFEPGGSKNWPSGYNPKPLISKSIRSLALSMFNIPNLTTRRV